MSAGARTRLRPAPVRPGARVAVIAPSSPIEPEELERGATELRALGFEPVVDASALAHDAYVAGTAASRAEAFLRVWRDPSVAAVIAARGGYGSAQILPWLDRDAIRATPKIFVGYSDTTALLSWLTTGCGLTALHGPMIDRRIASGADGVHRDSFLAALDGAAAGRTLAPPLLDVLRGGEAAGGLFGGTISLLCASLGTPYAFDPPEGSVLFLEEVNERPFRLDRMLTQLRLAGLFARASAVVFGEMPGCDDPGGLSARDACLRALDGFPGPILTGFPSGHTTGPVWTLPLGVRVRVRASGPPALVIDEEAVG
ncbi:MAG: LD-carboxypeptidase [Vicinamibacterales bacterium]